jgi:hypothetical protein
MADTSRLLAHATEAFVDRTPVDWTELLSRVRSSPERPLFESLRTLAALRNGHRSTALAPTASSRASFAAWLVVAFASVETICILGLLVLAAANGASIGDRRPQLVLALAFAAASLPLGSAAVRNPRSLFLLAAFVSAASDFARSAMTGLPFEWSAPLDKLLGGVVFEAFIPACLWEFASDFPRVTRFTRFDWRARHIASVSWFLGGLLFFVNVARAAHFVDAGFLVYLSRDHSGHLFWTFFSLAAALAMAAILVRSRRASFSERRKVARLALAIAGGTIPFLLFSTVETLLPVVYDWFTASASSGRIFLYRFFIATVAATPVLSTAAVLADRPFDLQDAVRRTSSYVLARSVLSGLTATPLVILFALLFGTRHVRIADAFSDFQVRLLLSCAAASSLLFASRERLLEAVDRRFATRPHNNHERLGRSLERISRARGTRETLALLTRELRDTIGAQTVRILLRKRDGSFADWLRDAAPLRSDGGVAALVREGIDQLDLSAGGPLRPLLPRADREWVTAHEVDLIVPLKRRDGSIGGIVALGPNRAGSQLDRQDRWLTATLAAAAAAVWTDDRPVDESDETRRRWRRPILHGEAAFECPTCGVVSDSRRLPCHCTQEARLASLPRHLGRKFLVERRLGAGSMGVVYLARDAALDRRVALKTLPELRPSAVRRLRDEARAMAALNHGSLATIYGLEMWRRTPVLVVEYFPEGTLARKLADGPLSPSQTVTLGLRVVDALAYMHARGMLHRDLKPSNIAFSANGPTKLLDFGLATLLAPIAHDDDLEVAEVVRFAGTPAYAPPEARRGERPSHAFDLWALSVVMLEAVTGPNPSAPRTKVGMPSSRESDAHDACLGRLGSHPALRNFLERALTRSPERRFQSSLEFLAGLEVVANDRGA